MTAADPLGSRLIDMAAQYPEAAWLLRNILAPRSLTPEALARIRANVAGESRRWVVRRARFRWWAFASLGMAGAAGAATVAPRIVEDVMRMPEELTPPVPAKSRSKKRRTPERPVLIESRIDFDLPSELPPMEEPPPPAPTLRPAPRTKAVARSLAPRIEADVPATTPVPSASALAEESTLLDTALRKLRRDRDGAGAIAALDRYRDRFPHGELAHEAERTRVEALLLQGRSVPALEVLDGMSFGTSLRDVGLVLTRGELRAEAGRCAAALEDFAGVLSRVQTGAAAERALYGRASCRSRTGDRAGARADMQAYLDRFPNGRHAADVRRALD